MINYSLHFLLSREVKEIINLVIKKLAEKYAGVIFEPHVTLLGGFICNEKEVVEKTKKLVSKIKKLNLEFGEVSFSTTYFQNVFVKIKSTADLMNANLEAKKEFSAENKFYMPHISFLYGDHLMADREKIVKEVVLPPLKFQASKITIVSGEKDPTTWKYWGEFELGN